MTLTFLSINWLEVHACAPQFDIKFNDEFSQYEEMMTIVCKYGPPVSVIQ